LSELASRSVLDAEGGEVDSVERVVDLAAHASGEEVVCEQISKRNPGRVVPGHVRVELPIGEVPRRSGEPRCCANLALVVS
jgi:hypothetical protein